MIDSRNEGDVCPGSLCEGETDFDTGVDTELLCLSDTWGREEDD